MTNQIFPFDPHRTAKSATARDLIESILSLYDVYEDMYRPRERKRSKSARAVFERTVEAVLCDILYREIMTPGGQVFITQSNQVLRRKSRYKGVALGKTLPEILKALSSAEMRLITLVPGTKATKALNADFSYRVTGARTLLGATENLRDFMRSKELTRSDFGRSEVEEVIVLRGPKPRADRQGELLEYTDTVDTEKMRADLREINRAIESSSLDCDLQRVDVNDCGLRRIFNNGDFEQGGRLYGGFWQRMNGKERLSSLVIDDQSAVELDYGQMSLTILYGLSETKPPEGDLYDLSDQGIPLSCRPGIKKVINAMIFSEKPLSRLPNGSRKHIPKKYTTDRVLRAVLKKHTKIRHHFYTGIGLKVMRQESDILVEVLLRLTRNGITALPIHDAVMVSDDHIKQTKRVMKEVFKEVLGVVPEVSVERE